MQMTLFRAATALLYLGPLFAGLAAFGWEMIGAFWAIFLLYLFVIRRSLFPRKPADWQNGPLLVRLAGQCLVQLLLVILCFAVGRGIGAVVLALPSFSPWWTLALSFISVPLCRWLAIQTLPTDPKPHDQPQP